MSAGSSTDGSAIARAGRSAPGDHAAERGRHGHGEQLGLSREDLAALRNRLVSVGDGHRG